MTPPDDSSQAVAPSPVARPPVSDAIRQLFLARIEAGIGAGILAPPPGDYAELIRLLTPPAGAAESGPAAPAGLAVLPSPPDTNRRRPGRPARVPEGPDLAVRMAIFAAVVAAQDDGFAVEMARSLVANRFKVSAAVVKAAEREGITNEWPPLGE